MMEKIRKMSLKELKALETLIAEERENRIENELSGLCANAVACINELLECCRKLGRHRLGTIDIECEDCDVTMYFDILADGILEDVSGILVDYIKE